MRSTKNQRKKQRRVSKQDNAATKISSWWRMISVTSSTRVLASRFYDQFRKFDGVSSVYQVRDMLKNEKKDTVHKDVFGFMSRVFNKHSRRFLSDTERLLRICSDCHLLDKGEKNCVGFAIMLGCAKVSLSEQELIEMVQCTYVPLCEEIRHAAGVLMRTLSAVAIQLSHGKSWAGINCGQVIEAINVFVRYGMTHGDKKHFEIARRFLCCTFCLCFFGGL